MTVVITLTNKPSDVEFIAADWGTEGDYVSCRFNRSFMRRRDIRLLDDPQSLGSFSPDAGERGLDLGFETGDKFAVGVDPKPWGCLLSSFGDGVCIRRHPHGQPHKMPCV